MGAGALAICHSKAAVQIRIREDMKKMVQLPVLKNLSTPVSTGDSGGQRVFGVSLMELNELGLVQHGVPLVLRSMVEYLRQHGMQQEGLFRVSASVRAVESLKQRLDSGEVLELEQDAEVCTVAGLLKQYLRELPEGLVHSSIHNTLLQLHDDSNEEGFCHTLRELLLQMPAVHYTVLRHLCHFLTQVEQQQSHNRMTAFNLATVFGPNVFHVSPGFEGMQEQNICNKIMAKLIQNYWDIFEPGGEEEQPQTKPENVIMVKEAHMDTGQTQESPPSPPPKAPVPVPRKTKTTQNSNGENTPRQPESKYETPVAVARKIKATQNSSGEDNESPRRTEQSLETSTAKPRKKKATPSSGEESASPRETEMNPKNPVTTPRKKKVKKAKTKVAQRSVPQPAPSTGLPFSRHLSQHPKHIRSPSTEPQFLSQGNPRADNMDLYPPALSPIRSTDALSSSQEEERPISPFYVSSQLSPGHYRPDIACYLEKTIRSAVEQHLFDGHMKPGQGSGQDPGSESASHRPFPVMTARQRRRQQREQEDTQERCRGTTDKENIPSRALTRSTNRSTIDEHERRRSSVVEGSRTRSPKHSPTLTEHSNNHDSLSLQILSKPQVKVMLDTMDRTDYRDVQKTNDSAYPKTRAMKIQEAHGCSEPSGGYEDIPRLDLSALTEDSNWGDPVPAYSSWQRETMDNEEARPSPQSGGKMISQLLEEGSDPMVSPRFYAYGNSQQYLDDTEVPPSPPNTHSFVSRRRSSSLGSCDNEREELTSTQLTKKIHNLKKKIRKFEEKFEDERKYRPSHSDKAANPEVLRWMNELAKLRKDLKEHHLQKSEEDLAPLPRQRSNTLPKSFGSQLEKKVSEPKAPKPPVENTLEAVMNKLQEKRTEAGRPEDIKDMTREQIGAEKVALQKALLYYEGIHGRPITKTERQLMKPLYDRYRLVKQILCRASTIPVIEEEDGSDDDDNNRTPVTQLVRPELSMLGFLEHLDEDMDGFISPVDELSPSKNTTDMRLSNLHAATMQELVEQLQEAREEKKRIRKNLREFEDQFFRQNGRNVQKEDRSPLAVEYNEYKHVKAKLRLLEVLISKRDSSKFI